MSAIGTRILERRKELQMTQEELAHKLGYKSKSSINKIELGLTDITQSKVSAFAEALNTTIAYLMGWDKEDKLIQEEEVLARRLLGNQDAKYAAFKLFQEMTEEEAETALKILEAYTGGKK